MRVLEAYLAAPAAEYSSVAGAVCSGRREDIVVARGAVQRFGEETRSAKV